mgnify:FL=1
MIFYIENGGIMKKLLCYLGILVLLFLLFLPPALRTFLKDKDATTNEDNNKTNATLVCKNDNFTINANYSGDDVLMIVLKRVIKEEENEELVSEPDKELNELFDSIKDDQTITYNKLEDSEVIGIDFEIYKHENLKMNLITKPIKDQQQYYESLNFKCLVR